VAGRYLPRALAGREKFSFVASCSQFLLNQRVDWIDDLLSPAMIRRQNFFDHAVVERLRQRQIAADTRLNPTFDTDILMLVLCFGLFLEVFDLPDYG